MADTHGHPPDPNVAPMHSEVKESFAPLDVTIAVTLGLVAIATGIVFGLIFVNN
jgi:hypothetical protein